MDEKQEKVIRRAGAEVDDRIGGAGLIKGQLKKLFPDHWSFMLGEIALYSFIILILTGIFLTFFYEPSIKEVVYHGSYDKLDGVTMSEAYQSTISLSFDIRGGLLIRQIHHWAALLFVAAIMVHMFRIFFTGAFRKPRETNWLIGITLFALAMLEGFAGYTLPDDLLSGVGLRIFVSGVFLGIPVIGTYLMYFAFGGAFPDGAAGEFIPRLYSVHILLVPGILLALIGAHLMIMWFQKHTVWGGKEQTEHNTVGQPFFPHFMAKTGAFFMAVFTVLAFFGAFVQINPIWMYGPYNPANVTTNAQPDWYIGFFEGALRMMPGVETTFLGHTIAWPTLVPMVIVPAILFTFLVLYPIFERWATGDTSSHQVLDRPRNVPVRTGVGVAWLTVYAVLWAAGGNDVIATTFDISLNATTWFFRVAFFIAPVLAFIVTKRICIGLQRKDLNLLHEGVETGVIRRTPVGGYEEATRPVNPEHRGALEANVADRPQERPELVDAHGVEAKGNLVTRVQTAAQHWYTQDNVARTGDGHAEGNGHAEGDGHAAVEESQGEEDESGEQGELTQTRE